MLRFALKNMAIKKIQNILIVLSIVISAGIAVLAYNVANQVSDGITKGASYYSVIIGPSGSQTQLAMNTMYFTDEPLGTIPYSVATDLMMDGTRVRSVVPFAMADNYNGSKVVGTTSEFLSGKELKEGTMYENNATLQAVVGYRVAKNNGLKVGDVIHTGHSVNSQELHGEGITVVGILKETHSAYDNVVFTQLQTLWKMHEHGEEEHEEEHEHTSGTVCAILVKTKNTAYAMQLVAIVFRILSIVLPCTTECNSIIIRVNTPIFYQCQWVCCQYLLQFIFIFFVKRYIIWRQQNIIA